jgi:hypothetical protein
LGPKPIPRDGEITGTFTSGMQDENGTPMTQEINVERQA